jgi:spermidine/putrescine transport system permease protein
MLKLRSTLLLLLPAVGVIGVFMAIPMLITLVFSFMTANTYGGVTMPLCVDAYVQMLFDQNFDGTLSFVPDYVIIMVRSVYLALATTVLTLLLGFPIAWYIFCQSPARRMLLLTLVTIPFWINTLIRTYCWILLLRDQGLVNDVLEYLRVIDHPLPLLYNQSAILLGLVYTFLPFMVLPIYATLERLDTRIIEAAYDLYVTRWRLFRRVIWPLSRPGVGAGAVLVFAPALGAFLQPDMLGGGKQLLIGSLIEMQFTASRDWPFGSALAIVVTLAVVIALILQGRRSNSGVKA